MKYAKQGDTTYKNLNFAIIFLQKDFLFQLKSALVIAYITQIHKIQISIFVNNIANFTLDIKLGIFF